MTIFTISIPDELLPGLVAAANAISTPENPKTPEDVAQEYAESAARKICQDMGVGPYWVMPQPQFNADGTFYHPPTVNGDNSSVDVIEPVTKEEGE
jgi:hypothetical protein